MNTKDKGTGRAPSAQNLIWGVAVLLVVLFGCQSPTSSTPAVAAPYTTYLYMTEYAGGRVYTYDPATHSVSTASLVTTAANAGEIKFYKGIGYVAIGSGTGGVYYFNPGAAAPSATLLSGTGGLFAQYFAFSNSTQAYFSVATNYGSDIGGVYSFNPSNPSAGVTQLAQPTKYMQEILVGSDGMLYGTENLDQAVVRIDPTTNTVKATIATTKSGPTGLLAGTFNGTAGMYVANTGGSLDFIANGASTATAVATTSGSTPFYPARLVQLSNGNIMAVGSDPSYAGHTYLVTLSGTTATPVEIKAGSSSFGGNFSLAYDSTSNLVYVPTNVYGTSNSLYVFSGAGAQQSFSPLSVLTSSSNLANVAFYQN